MNKKTYRITLALLLGVFSVFSARAQYSTEGVDPFSTRWSQYKTDRYRLIYPEGNRRDAGRVAVVLDTAYHALHYGLSRPMKRIPIILHTQNLRSNGVVTWTPKRAELITTPQTETFAMPWLKQLTVHESRHAVQMSNLDRHWFRWLKFPFGEQATGAAAIFLPKWYLEGDAVFAETAMSAYGRALQPEFTIAYRAYLEACDVRRFPIDKWFCGSYKDYIPNHYYLGYQLVNASYKLYGPQFWETVVDHVTKHPYQVIPRPVAFRKYFNTSSGQLFRQTFRSLKAQWDALPPVEENMTILPTPTDSYTVYSWPVAAGGEIIALKYDFVRPYRLVAVNPRTAGERVLAYTANVSSRPAVSGGELLWTEYQASTFWEQKNRSVLRAMPLNGSARPRTVEHPGNLFYPTPYHGRAMAAVSYDPEEKYSVVFFDAAFYPIQKIALPTDLTVHGMAWDEKTNTLALITLSEQGMNLSGLRPESNGLYPITEPSFVTINHLTAADGKLFFNSIRSGIDESHFFDLETRQEYRISTSKFGTVMPSYDPATGTVVQASYRCGGYLLSTQKLSETEFYPHSPLPENRVNPSMADLGLPNLDTMRLFAEADTKRMPSKRYRKGTHLFNVHSWAPVSFDVFDAANSSDRNLELNAGVTIMSQNDLSNTEAYLSYGYVNSQSWWRGAVRFNALAPKFEISAEYGGGYRSMARPAGIGYVPEGWADKKYFSVGGTVYLSVGLSSGGTARALTPSVTFRHYNTALWQPDKSNFVSGYERAEYALSYAQNCRQAYRDLAPRWGFGVRASYAHAPFNDLFGQLWSLYGNVYLPGVMTNHSLRLRGAVQGQSEQYYHFSSNVLFPRGIEYTFAPKKLWTAVGEYRFPLAYPDWGIDQFLYVKRISLNVFGGYSRFQTPGMTVPGWYKAWSYGGEFSFDFDPLRMTGHDFNFKAAFYKTSHANGIGASISLSVDL
ncbi:hypothetical protein LJB87_02580 [Alistipes sp. OttesenSCG-928-L06]|nr:hypothetical protein [Alistipes sp. OttesenSCG-928-L06]